jgi:uncharacterized membrane protein YbaN (DUF454 family)
MTRHFVKILWVIGGLVSLVLGTIGIALPLLPTTPFLLLAAFCFARGSEKMNNWMLNHKTLGPPIIDWRDYGAISKKAKTCALVVIVATPVVTYFVGAPLWAIAVQSVILVLVCLFIYTRPLPPE